MSNVIPIPRCGMCNEVMHLSCETMPAFNGKEVHVKCYSEFEEDMERAGADRLDDFNEHFDEIMDDMARYYDEE